MKIETLCGSKDCPINKICANFSTDESKNLVEYEFNHIKANESDEVEIVECDNFQSQIEDEFYK